MSKHIVIAIDGPSAAGKGTLAKRLAHEFGLNYLDTGLLYRITGLTLLKNNLNPSSEDHAVKAAKSLTPESIEKNAKHHEIRWETTAKAASTVAAFPKVREALFDFQRHFANTPSSQYKGAILDGRDIGTTICPDADLKIFITASNEARAKRRFLELQETNKNITVEDVLHQLKQRDENDTKRAASPLTPAEDALIIDTSTLSPNDVFEKLAPLVTSILQENA